MSYLGRRKAPRAAARRGGAATLARLRVELEGVRTRLARLDASVAGGCDDHLKATSAADLVDSAQMTEQQELAHLGRVRLLERLHELGRAIARVEDGDYGVCEGCREPIPPRRLQALPGVTTCVACQTALEGR